MHAERDMAGDGQCDRPPKCQPAIVGSQDTDDTVLPICEKHLIAEFGELRLNAGEDERLRTLDGLGRLDSEGRHREGDDREGDQLRRG